ncbi:MAG: 4Fe-4S dicluster domain-containing protein [Bacillota bacterium]|nr:4Fe-4S dicluster domain-containing protein [Bacillota bacterium]
MKEITNKIQEIASRLLQEGQVDVFLAWEQGGEAFQTRPYFARTVEEAKNLVFNEYSIHNIANSLLKFRDGQEKIGVVAKGCDSRGIVRLMEDNQISRDRLYIIGIPCPGMKDPLIAARNHSGFNKANESEEGIAKKCRDCIQPNPVIYDELIGEEVAPHFEGERFAKVREIEAMSPDERYKFFEDTLSTCIRCYACRQVCVACDCRTCIFDEMKPQWVGRENNTTDNMMYHIVKASHMAGRCIECGECERVCPVNIPLMVINQKLIKDVDEFFGPYEAGMKYEEGVKPALSMYKEDDPDNFL